MKVALVTGANTGIGYAVAERLLRDGYALGFHTRARDNRSRDAFLRLSELGRVNWISGDLADPAVPAQVVSDALDKFQQLDVLVNNAGLTTAGPALDLTSEQFDEAFAVDVRAPFLAAQAAARAMTESGGGVIVNITSIHETVARPGFAVYSAAKAALGMLTHQLGLELAPAGVRVVSVAPGVIATERNTEAESMGPEIPVGRSGRPEEVAGLVAWLCSGEAAYVTGASYLIDGALAQRGVARPAD